MEDEPDLNFDIDALFDHLANNLDYQSEDEQDWHFFLRSSDISALEQVADELESEFVVQIQEHVEEVEPGGNVSLGDPMLSVIRRGALKAEDVKRIDQRMRQIANDRGLTYEGVDCYDPIDEEEIFGWLAPEDAGWRLRHMTDCGLPDNADLPWTFLVDAPTLETMHRIASTLQDSGFDDRNDYDEPDDEGNFGICVFVAGRNNEFELEETASKISTAADSEGGTLIGIQFYDREAFAEIFGDGDQE